MKIENIKVLKNKIRKKILKLRELNFNDSKKINLNKVKEIITNYKKKSLILGGYYPINYEIDCISILENLEKKSHKISLPVIKKNNQMDFHTYSFGDPLKLNKYGIPEPLSKEIVFPDILFVPLVAFDGKLFRLGYGGGYYDRYIEKIDKKKFFLKIGFAFNCQKISRVPVDVFDKSLDIVITENKVYE